MIGRDLQAFIDFLYDTDIAGWSLLDIIALCVGILCITGAVFIMVRASRRGR